MNKAPKPQTQNVYNQKNIKKILINQSINTWIKCKIHVNRKTKCTRWTQTKKADDCEFEHKRVINPRNQKYTYKEAKKALDSKKIAQCNRITWWKNWESCCLK